MKRNMMWLLLGMAVMGGGHALADCLVDPMPNHPISMPGCLQGFVPHTATLTHNFDSPILVSP